MDKLINTFKYGDLKTRLYLGAVVVLMLAGIICGGIGVSSANLILIGVGGVMLIVDVVLVFQLTSSPVDAGGETGDKPVGKQTLEETAENSVRKQSAEVIKNNMASVEEENHKRPKEKKKKLKKVKPQKAPKVKNKKQKKQKTQVKAKDRDKAMVDRTVINRTQKKTARTARGEKTPVNTTDYTEFTVPTFKQLIKRYKVPKKHLKLIVDSCKSLAIDHSPVLCYVKRGRMYFVVLEGKPRCESIPFTSVYDVTYRKNVKEEDIKLYNSMRDMEVYSDFEEFMPTFSIQGGPLGDNQYFKNLYCIGKDILVPPRSMKVLMAQFKFRFRIFDSLGIKGQHSVYFKRAYEQRILWSDNVISQNEYQSNIREILQSMVDDESLIRYDFIDDLEKMVRHRLITDEYATFYRTKRD